VRLPNSGAGVVIECYRPVRTRTSRVTIRYDRATVSV
jgi:hypothetical protein